MHKTLNEQMSVCILNGVHSSMLYRPSQAPCLNDAALGVDQQIVIHGIGGAGKIILADAVDSSMKWKLHVRKHFKASLIQIQELDPNVEDLQSQIIQDLTFVKQKVRDSLRGKK